MWKGTCHNIGLPLTSGIPAPAGARSLRANLTLSGDMIISQDFITGPSGTLKLAMLAWGSKACGSSLKLAYSAPSLGHGNKLSSIKDFAAGHAGTLEPLEHCGKCYNSRPALGLQAPMILLGLQQHC